MAKKESVQGLIATSSSLLIYGVSAIAILFTYYGSDIIGFFYGFEKGIGFNERLDLLESVSLLPKVVASSEVFQLLILGIIPMSINYCFGTLITASGNMKVLNRIAFVSLLLNIILNFILIPKYGAYGAAMASLVTQSASGIGQVIFTLRLFDVSINARGGIRFFAGIAIVSLSFQFLNELELFNRVIAIVLLGLLGLFVSVNLNGVLKMAKGLKGESV